MAEKKGAKAAAAPAAPVVAEAKSSKKMLIIIAIVVLLTIAISVGATFFLLSGKDEASAEGGEVVAAEPVKLPALYYDLQPPFVVTLSVDGKQRYMQIYVSVMTRDQRALDTLTLHMPLIRNKMIMLYSSQNFEAVQTAEGKDALREKSKEVIQEILTQESEGAVIEQVLFTNFVMQ
jgi:flagellar FliL protein